MDINKTIKDVEEFKAYIDRFTTFLKDQFTENEKEKQQLSKQVEASNSAAAKVKQGMKNGVGTSQIADQEPQTQSQAT